MIGGRVALVWIAVSLFFRGAGLTVKAGRYFWKSEVGEVTVEMDGG